MNTKIYRAGTIPYYLDDNNVLKMLFMIPSDQTYGGNQPQIAKGKQDDGETLLETALRESEEELGLKKSNILNFFKVGLFLGRTEIYAIKIIDMQDFNSYNFETQSTMWLTEAEFMDIGRDLHKGIVEETVTLIRKKEYLD